MITKTKTRGYNRAIRFLHACGHDAGCVGRQACPTTCSRYRASLLGSSRATTIDLECAADWMSEAAQAAIEDGRGVPGFSGDEIRWIAGERD